MNSSVLKNFIFQLATNAVACSAMLFMVGCKSGTPESTNAKEFPSPVFDRKVGSEIALSSLTAFTLTGRCIGAVQSIEVSTDNTAFVTLPASQVRCSIDGTFSVTENDIPSSNKIYARARGKGRLLSQVVDANLVIGTQPPSSNKFSIAMASGYVSGGAYKVKFAVGYNQVGATAAGGGFKTTPSSAGVIRGQ